MEFQPMCVLAACASGDRRGSGDRFRRQVLRSEKYEAKKSRRSCRDQSSLRWCHRSQRAHPTSSKTSQTPSPSPKHAPPPSPKSPSPNQPRTQSTKSRTLTIFSTLLFLTPPASTAPTPPLAHLQNRQSIPDQSGRTGNAPIAPIKPDNPPRPPPLPISIVPSPIPTTTSASASEAPLYTTITVSSTISLLPTQTLSSTLETFSSPSDSTPTSVSTPSPNPPLSEPQEPPTPVSAGAISGIAIGSLAFLILIVGVAILFCCSRRRGHTAAAEIPRHTSSQNPNTSPRHSRTSSRSASPLSSTAAESSSHAAQTRNTNTNTNTISRSWSQRLTKKPHSTNERKNNAQGGKNVGVRRAGSTVTVRKSNISHPRAVVASEMPPAGIEWLEKPRPAAFLVQGRPNGIVEEETGMGGVGGQQRRYVYRAFPVRPLRSAEPLGRLSGMGLGMGLGSGNGGVR